MITLLRGECYSSHLLFTCFLVLSLTLCLFFLPPCSFRFVSVKRRRCDHSAISALVETNLICAQNRQLFKFLPSQMPITFSFHKKKYHNLSKPLSCTDHILIEAQGLRFCARKQESQNLMNADPFLCLVMIYQGEKNIYKNTLACFGIRC